jgi:hypothetical protein
MTSGQPLRAWVFGLATRWAGTSEGVAGATASGSGGAPAGPEPGRRRRRGSTLSKLVAAATVAIPTLAHAVDPANLPVPPQGFDAKNNSIPHGKVEASLSYSTRMYGMQKVTVYTPPDYSTSQKYPVMYLHHGIGGNEVAWIGQGSNEGNADNIMDYLYSKSLAKPMIVVMPDGNTRGASDGFTAHEDVLLNDLIPWVAYRRFSLHRAVFCRAQHQTGEPNDHGCGEGQAGRESHLHRLRDCRQLAQQQPELSQLPESK